MEEKVDESTVYRTADLHEVSLSEENSSRFPFNYEPGVKAILAIRFVNSFSLLPYRW